MFCSIVLYLSTVPVSGHVILILILLIIIVITVLATIHPLKLYLRVLLLLNKNVLAIDNNNCTTGIPV